MASPCLAAICSAVLCRWVADDAAPSGALVHFDVRPPPQFPSLKSNETGEGLENRWWIVRTASRRWDSINVGGQTCGFIKGESAAANHGGNILLIHTGPLILPIWCCCCCCCWWCKRNLRDVPPVKARSLLCLSFGCGDTSEDLKDAGLPLFLTPHPLLQIFMSITTHHSHCGNKVNRPFNQQYGRICAPPSLQKWIWSVAGSLTVRFEACEVNDISGREALQ